MGTTQSSFHSTRVVLSAGARVRFDARLYFANVPFLEEWLISEVADRTRVKWVVIDCRGVNSIDVTAIEGLERMVSEHRSRGIEILFAHIKLQVRERLERAGWHERFGDIEYPTTRDALRAVGLLRESHSRDAR